MFILRFFFNSRISRFYRFFETISPFIVTYNKFIINVTQNVMLVLIRFSVTFYLVVPKHFFLIPLISPLGYKRPPPPPPPPFISPPKTPYEVISAQGFKVGFYGISLTIAGSIVSDPEIVNDHVETRLMDK